MNWHQMETKMLNQGQSRYRRGWLNELRYYSLNMSKRIENNNNLYHRVANKIEEGKFPMIFPQYLNIFMKMIAKIIIILGANIILISTIEVHLTKRNVFIPQNSHFTASIELQRQNAQLIPTTISLQTFVTNTIPKFGDYFDYFYYLTQKDLTCYQDAVQNQSFLFPCSFLSNHYSKNRVQSIDSQQINQSIEDINDVKFSFIVDNTLFPYPHGAYSYSNINVDIATTLDVKVSSSYQILGKRLIFINVTIFLIFMVIIITIICKTNNISKKMDISKGNSSHEKHSPYLEEIDEEFENSFISDGEVEEQMIKQDDNGIRQVILSESLRGSKQNAVKFLSGREDQEAYG